MLGGKIMRRLGDLQFWRAVAFGFLVVFFGTVSAGRATDIGADPRVVARAYGEVPEGATLSVQVPDQSDVNLWVRDTMIGNLQRLGYTVADDAALVMKLSAEVRNDSTEGSRFSLEGQRGLARDNSFTLNYRLPLGEGKSQPSQTSISIIATISKDGGRPLWQGTASSTAMHRQALDVQPALIAALANAVGKTVGGSSY